MSVIPLSATLAANEILIRKRQAGEPVLPLSFGEAGLPVHPVLKGALAHAAGNNAYGPVSGLPALREAAAGYWTRRTLPTTPDAVICGPGSKPLLFGLLLALGADVAVPQPSWVSYAAQAGLIGARPHFVPTPAGEGGICDPATVQDLADVATRYDLIVISDEIYRDLVYEPAPAVASPVDFAPERTVVTTGLSKNLALGGWRIGVARLPDGPLGAALRGRLLGIGSEIWSAAAGPVQEAAALAFGEPPELAERIARSRSLHETVCRAVADRFAATGVIVPEPQAAFYLYPDFAPWREHLAERHGVTTGAGLAGLLLERYGVGVLPASAFGEDESVLRVRVATGLLYGDTDARREQALASDDPAGLPWIAASLGRLEEVLATLAP
jgi:aspartate aminotransferase